MDTKPVEILLVEDNEGDVGLDTSYDGGTVGLNTDLGIKKDNERTR